MRHVLPFSVSNSNLQEIEDFSERNGLEQLTKLCAEVRMLRQLYLEKEAQVIRLQRQLERQNHVAAGLLQTTYGNSTNAP